MVAGRDLVLLASSLACDYGRLSIFRQGYDDKHY